MRNNMLMVVIVAALMIAPLVAAEVQYNAVLDVDLLKFEPVPAKPGDTIDVWIQVSNRGGTSANYVTLLVDESYPFTPVTENDREVGIGTLAPQSQYVAKVQVSVDRDAPNGAFILQARTTTNNQDFTQFDLPIEVQSTNAALSVQAAKTSPVELVPGSTADLILTLENVEDALLRDLTVTLGLDDSVFAPVGNTNQQKLSRLDGGKSAIISFSLVPEPNAASGVYRIPVTFTFTTNEGTSLTQIETVGIVVRAAPELSLIVDEAEVYDGTEEGTVLLRLVNKGLSEIKFAEVTLETGTGFSLASSSPTVYVGNIDSDDFETVEYVIKHTEDEFTLPVVIRYKDALNQPYEERFNLQVREQPKANGSGGSSTIIIVIVLAVAAFIGYRVYKARRKR